MDGGLNLDAAGPLVPAWARTLAAVAFDCFGTLADFSDQQFAGTFADLCNLHSAGSSGKDLWDRWIDEGRRLWVERGRNPDDPLAGPEPEFLTYRQAWEIQFERSFGALGAAGSGAVACARLLEDLSSATPFPEVPELLAALRSTYRLAVMSNADDAFLLPFLRRNQLEFEIVLSSEAARSYKPRVHIFRHLCELLRLRPHEVLYVGDNPAADLLGARAAGLAVAWINRTGATLPARVPPPDVEMSDLRELLQILPLLTPPERAAGPSA